jgi:8-oxo-dGTP diphosphatase
VTVDIVIFAFFEGDLHVLLIQRKGEPFRLRWALPGGFVHIDEGLEAAAARELAEETGAHDVYLEQLYTFGTPDRDPRERVITVVYFALISEDQVQKLQLRAETDAADVRWWSTDSLPPLAFDHGAILAYALKRLRWKMEWTAVAFELLPPEFSLSHLQQVYERVLNEELDKRNFRRKILALEILEETGELSRGGHRPARLYRFTRQAIELELARRRLP